MRRAALFFAAIWTAVPAVSQLGAAVYDIDPGHSEISFRIRHLVSKISGRFTGFSGIIEFEPGKPLSLKAEATISAESVSTGNGKRDEHLKSADFFNVAKFPLLTFKSTGMKSLPKEKERIQMTGDLTLLGTTKPVTLDVVFNGMAVDPSSATRAGFTAKGTINRKDFGMNYNVSTDKGVVIGDEVELLLEVQAVERKPAK